MMFNRETYVSYFSSGEGPTRRKGVAGEGGGRELMKLPSDAPDNFGAIGWTCLLVLTDEQFRCLATCMA